MPESTIAQIKTLLDTNKATNEQLQAWKQDERAGVQQVLNRYEKKQQQINKELQMYADMSRFEKEYHQQGIQLVAGVDEVGRGPLAGPVTAAAVILPETLTIPGLTDSKKLSEAKRNYYSEIIKEKALAYCIKHVGAADIDKYNIYQASKMAMTWAVEGLDIKAGALLVDAMELPISLPQKSLIKGDSRSVSIAAASVIAKVERDAAMKKMAEAYPGYSFEDHKGYGTKAHLEALKQHGLTRHHRRSFKPVSDLL
ncbi:RNase HII [Sinobaca qinghaiensis]|uniref:Ribonuclease HII n=1 Tax=Sinobaca qinghaiensis TaxID=342944 RepID=A0A419V604_9BACL|nr:ribonuclease HII [Sinobaca qinghaiensis]RKD75389.1 RNase HII [Sinobaca qinghaiensis]